MKKITTYLAALSALLLVTFGAQAQIGGPPVTLFSYGPSTNYWFSTNGIATTNGFTTGLVKLETAKSPYIGLYLYAAGRADFTQSMTLKAWPSYDGVNKVILNNANVALTPFVWAVTATGTTPIYATTNLLVTTAAHGPFVNAPYLLFELSKIGVNDAAATAEATNVVVKANLK